MIRKSLSEGELYLKDLYIDTFDGSGSLTHPYVLYFEKGINNYKFWMTFTPYDNNDVELENPCMVVSNDGVHFQKIPAQPDPLLDIVPRGKPNTYYSDPFILFRNELELWYRFTIESIPAENRIYKIVTRDGVNYSTPKIAIYNDEIKSYYMSMSITLQAGSYHMYYFDIDNYVYLRTSKDLKTWSHPKKVHVEGFFGKFWHGEVKILGDETLFLFMDTNYNIYLSKQKDQLTFNNCRKINLNYNPKKHLYLKAIPYKSSIISVNDYYYIYIPFRVDMVALSGRHKKWRLTLTKIKKSNLETIL